MNTVHHVRLVNASRQSQLSTIRAECSCGWRGSKVRFRHTAQRHAEKHKAAAEPTPPATIPTTTQEGPA